LHGAVQTWFFTNRKRGLNFAQWVIGGKNGASLRTHSSIKYKVPAGWRVQVSISTCSTGPGVPAVKEGKLIEIGA
jgi:hypothetical protein